MFSIPENLPLEIAPLAWMLGPWKGWGMLSIDEGDDQPIYEEAEGTICGKQMKLVTARKTPALQAKKHQHNPKFLA